MPKRTSLGAIPDSSLRTMGVVMIDTPQKPTSWNSWKEAMPDTARFGGSSIRSGTGSRDGKPLFRGGHHRPRRDAQRFLSEIPFVGFGIDGVGPWIARADPEGVSIAGDYKPREPEITFSRDATLYVGGLEFQLLFTPGHTTGEIAVFVPQRGVLFASDNLFVDHLIGGRMPIHTTASIRSTG